MGRLLENVFKNRYTGKIFENIEANPSDSLPVSVTDPTWEEKSDDQKNYLHRSYTFEDDIIFKYFINKLIEIGVKTNHHPEVSFQEKNINIKIYTHMLNDITEADINMSKEIDKIVNDLNYLNR